MDEKMRLPAGMKPKTRRNLINVLKTTLKQENPLFYNIPWRQRCNLKEGKLEHWKQNTKLNLPDLPGGDQLLYWDIKKWGSAAMDVLQLLLHKEVAESRGVFDKATNRFTIAIAEIRDKTQ